MKKKLFVTMIMTPFLVLSCYQAKAQTAPPGELPKYEVAADFSSLSLDSGTNLPGLGGRFTYNLSKHVALEAAGYFFPGKCESCNGEVTGRITQGLFGVKAGKRFKKWGLFGKARPGFASFSQGAFSVRTSPSFTSGGQVQCFGPGIPNPLPCFSVNYTRQTHPVVDLGAVLEFYPSKRIVVRFDGGNTMIRYTRRTYNTLLANPANPAGVPILAPVTDPGRTRNSFQFVGGVGFRF